MRRRRRSVRRPCTRVRRGRGSVPPCLAPSRSPRSDHAARWRRTGPPALPGDRLPQHSSLRLLALAQLLLEVGRLVRPPRRRSLLGRLRRFVGYLPLASLALRLLGEQSLGFGRLGPHGSPEPYSPDPNVLAP